MSSGPENRFRNSLHRLLPQELHHEKMHNPYRGGTFDDWYSGNKADIWVEYKYGKNPLSELQKKWGRERYEEGRKVFVIVGHPTGGVLYTTPKSWEAGVGGTDMTKAEIVAWLVDQTMGNQKTDGASSKPKAVKRSTSNRKSVQNPSDRSTNI